MTPKLKKEIEKGLKASWSPEQICGRYQLEQKPMVAFKTIYNWLYAGLIDLVFKRPAPEREKVDKPKETRGHLGLARRLPNVLKRSGIVRPLVTGSSILWCPPEAKARVV